MRGFAADRGRGRGPMNFDFRGGGGGRGMAPLAGPSPPPPPFGGGFVRPPHGGPPPGHGPGVYGAGSGGGRGFAGPSRGPFPPPPPPAFGGRPMQFPPPPPPPHDTPAPFQAQRGIPPPPAPRPGLLPPPPPIGAAPHVSRTSVAPPGGAGRPMVPPPYPAQSVPVVAPAAVHPPPPLPLYTPAQIDAAWRTYTDQASGRTYYANSLINKSQYERPDCLKAAEERQRAATAGTTTTTTITAAATPAAAAVTATASTVAAPAAPVWKEYRDVTTGKPYYSNGVTTTWEKPAELAAAAAAATPTTTTTAGDVASAEPASRKRARPQSPAPTEFASKAEAIAAFKGLLLVKDVGPTLKWHEVVKLCQADRRWGACLEVLSTGACKQALAEYQTKRANELRDLERKERARAKVVFTELLSSVAPTLKGFSAYSSRFADVRDALSKDERFYVVAEEVERESLYHDFCEEYRKREERRQINRKRLVKEQYIAFLQEKNEENVLLYSSTWSSFLSSLPDSDLQDERFAASPELSDQDRQLFFADFVLELQKEEDDKRRRIREATERAEQEQRDAFIAVLKELALNGKLLPASRWRNVEDQLSSHPSYAPIQARSKDAPRDLFDEFMNEWNTKYRKERTFLSQIIYPSSKNDEVVKAETTFDEFVTALLEKASEQSPEAYEDTKAIADSGFPISSARLYFTELSMRANGVSGPRIFRHSSAYRGDSDSSEDEGEIIEDEL